MKFSSNVPQYDHAIIIGGSFGGMVTAAYLTKYFSRITIIESDDVLNDALMKSTPDEILDYRCRLGSPTSIGRSGVAQIYQIHVLAGEGRKILREVFPQL
jgi:2-polyprenyl-6-methoxyphenol hydroxylase-like FAD-dependent oxidoreductase